MQKLSDIEKLEESFTNGLILQEQHNTKKELQQQNADGAETEATTEEASAKPVSIKELVANIPESGPGRLETATKIRKMLAVEQRRSPINEVVEAGAVPLLVQLLSEEHASIQLEAAWALTNITAGSSGNTRVVVDNGAVEAFKKLLKSPNEEVREQVLWVLGNIAGDSAEFRNMLLKNDIMEAMIEELSGASKLTLVRTGTWALSKVLSGRPLLDLDRVKLCLPVLCKLIKHTDDIVLTDAAWGFSYLSDGPNDRIQCVIDSGACNRIANLLRNGSLDVQPVALRTIGNIVSGNEVQTQYMINLGVLQGLRTLLDSTKRPVIKQACWAVSNITAGNREQIQAVLDANLFPTLINLISHTHYDIRSEAAFAVANACSGGSPEQNDYLVAQGAIQCFCNNMSGFAAPRVIIIMLEALAQILKPDRTRDARINIIEECGGVDILDQLQHHHDQGVYEKAFKLLSDYFATEEEGEGGEHA